MGSCGFSLAGLLLGMEKTFLLLGYNSKLGGVGTCSPFRAFKGHLNEIYFDSCSRFQDNVKLFSKVLVPVYMSTSNM